ncbi:hypothetical protein [Desulfoluna sp.]|uniref:hypothetical protein n=1 Tax=Desulfoluna sp. TaxID=2045199 RepID=UPI00261B1E5C|nr:hypothetical protein [Desulfoluna sp.]
MKNLRKIVQLFLFVLMAFLSASPQPCRAQPLPRFFLPVEKANARYDTPENALVARISSLVHQDIDWYFETLTPETVTIHKQLYQKAGLEPEVALKLYHKGTRYLIIDQEPYNGYIIVTGKSIKPDGTIQMGASLFEQVDGHWKTAFPSSDDETLMGRLQDKMDYIRPDDFFSVEGRFLPSTFHRGSDARLPSVTGESVALPPAKEQVLCVLDNLRDLKGEPIALERVDLESLLANHVVRATGVALLSREQVKVKLGLSLYDGAVLRCLFDRAQLRDSQETQKDDPEVTVFGRLKDGTPFQARVGNAGVGLKGK